MQCIPISIVACTIKMDYLSLLVGILFVYTCIHFLIRNITAGKSRLPPGPRPFPIIGNILELGNKPHQSLTNLSKTYGPIMTLKLGSITTIVVSSPTIAKEALQKHDQVLSSRAVPDGLRALNHHKSSVVWLPASPQWKNLRKVCVTQMLSTQRLDVTETIRRKKVQELLDYVQENCVNGTDVDIGHAAFTTVLNSLSMTLISIDVAHYHSYRSQNLKEVLCQVMEEIGKPNLADYFPVLGMIDPQGFRKRMTSHIETLCSIFVGIINERIKGREASSTMFNESNDVLDLLLNLAEEKKSEFSRTDIKHLLVDLFMAGIDTTSSAVEWAMAELLYNPEKLTKAQAEVREAFGKGGLQEFEISKLPYLQAIVKETFRLHPSFLMPHKADMEIELGGFNVPKNAQVLVNLWGMGRDSSIWQNPNSFVPERFLESEIDVKGTDFELIPFGAGRRICPGLLLAHRTVHLLLASLVYAFDWKLADGLKPDDLNMDDNFGLAFHRSVPLRVVPINVNVAL